MKEKATQGLKFIGIFVVILATRRYAFAQYPPGRRPPATQQEFFAILENVEKVMYTLLLILATIFIIVSAIRYATSLGSPEKVKAAHRTLIYSLVAVAVAVLSEALITVVKTFLTIPT